MAGFDIGINHDKEANVLFLKLRDTRYGSSRELDEAREVLFDMDGNVLGIEFLYVSDGVVLDGIPQTELLKVKRLLAEAKVEVKALTPA